jgi:hypothetical protein
MSLNEESDKDEAKTSNTSKKKTKNRTKKSLNESSETQLMKH